MNSGIEFCPEKLLLAADWNIELTKGRRVLCNAKIYGSVLLLTQAELHPFSKLCPWSLPSMFFILNVSLFQHISLFSIVIFSRKSSLSIVSNVPLHNQKYISHYPVLFHYWNFMVHKKNCWFAVSYYFWSIVLQSPRENGHCPPYALLYYYQEECLTLEGSWYIFVA
jgi:hypothetical protein